MVPHITHALGEWLVLTSEHDNHIEHRPLNGADLCKVWIMSCKNSCTQSGDRGAGIAIATIPHSLVRYSLIAWWRYAQHEHAATWPRIQCGIHFFTIGLHDFDLWHFDQQYIWCNETPEEGDSKQSNILSQTFGTNSIIIGNLCPWLNCWKQ